MGSAQRRTRAKENLRRAILDAARKLFATEDYKAVSMRRIAEEIEYSPTALYLHFKDKEEILLRLIEEGFDMLSGRLESIRTADPIERLREGGHIYFAFGFEQPHYYRIMFQLEDKEMAERRSEQSDCGTRTFGFIRRAVQEAQEQNLLPSDQEEIVLSHTLWAYLHGAVSLTLSGHLKMLPEALNGAFLDTVINTGLLGMIGGK
jgi:AcrR family transcriptional regulator